MRFFVTLILFGSVAAKKGFDAIGTISVSTFECLKKDGYDFYVARVWEEINNYDLSGIQNIKHARQAGFTDVDGYIYPCLRSNCPAGSKQVEAVIDKLHAEGAKIGMLWLDVEG
ncbi:unnamed protein product, partial [Mesorhabditis spiculigera]